MTWWPPDSSAARVCGVCATCGGTTIYENLVHRCGTIRISPGTPPWAPGVPQTSNPQWICPDLLRYEQIGAADGWRGRVVRGFFWLMRGWPT